MSELLKKAVVAGVIYKLLSKKKKPEKNNIYSLEWKTPPSKAFITTLAIIFIVAGISFFIVGIIVKGFGLLIGVGIISILYAIIFYFWNTKKST